MSKSLGHHPDRMTDVPGDKMDWATHQAIHEAERQVLREQGIRQDAFDRALGNVENQSNLPPRRPYGSDKY
jgi:hypothetical protein